MAERKEIKFFKIDNITQATIKDSLYAVKGSSENTFKLYVTDLDGNLVPLFTSSGGITNITSTDSSILVTGSSVRDLRVSTSLQSLISSALQTSDPVSSLLNDVGYFENFKFLICAEDIPSYTPVAIYNNQAYRFDASNQNHQFSFVGFSVNGNTTGDLCKIQQYGELELIGWGLTPNTQYLAGTSGVMVTNNTTPNNFTKVVGYATTSNTLEIIKDYTSVN